MRRISQEFDETLFALKMSEPSRQLQIESLKPGMRASRTAGGFFTHNGLIEIVDGHLTVLRKWLEVTDRSCREVWQTQGEMVTSDFVHDVLVPKAFTTIEVRVGVIKSSVDRAAFGSPQSSYAARHHLAMAEGKLKAEVANRYDIEARELEYRNASKNGQRVASGPRPINGLNASECQLEAEAEDSSVSRVQNSDKTKQRVESQTTNRTTAIGRNIDRLRKECGWSYDNLADATGIDKKLVLSHVHGKHKPNPKTAKVYAQGFAKELHRPITANDLEN